MVITGSSRDPVYASGFFTEVIGVAPASSGTPGCGGSRSGGPSTPPATGIALAPCRAIAGSPSGRRDAADDGPLRPLRGRTQRLSAAVTAAADRRGAGPRRRRRLGLVQPILHLSIPVRDLDEARDVLRAHARLPGGAVPSELRRRVVLRHAGHPAGPAGRGGRAGRGGLAPLRGHARP